MKRVIGMTKGKGKKKTTVQLGQEEYTMKLVTSDRCEVCKTPCARGMEYIERMSQPGAVGSGVPCVLTRSQISG
ncbi:hypothetical protein [Paenibacillus sp. B1-35]|uniref:hypothetical protein n=2 Tax=Paenibacillus TaxID=44249 RepID=UPI003D2B90BD